MAEGGGRMGYVDALRGLASLSVFVHHAANRVIGHKGYLPAFVDVPASYGYLGVEVFFVLSGFVIAHSTRDLVVTGRGFASFVARRSLRLDPPYWAAIAMAIAVAVAGNVLLHSGAPMPGPGDVALHVLYLQDLVGIKDINPVFWSLCIEFQMYLAFVLLQGVAQRLPIDANKGRIAVFFPLALASIAAAALDEPGVKAAHLGPWGYMFLLGAMVRWSLSAEFPRAATVVVIAAAFLGAAVSRDPSGIAAAGTALAVAGFSVRRPAWLERPALTRLGELSYSFYLVHHPICSSVASVMVKLVGRGPAFPVAVFGVALVASLIAASLMYRIVEVPSIALARRVSRMIAGEPGESPAYSAARPAP